MIFKEEDLLDISTQGKLSFDTHQNAYMLEFKQMIKAELFEAFIEQGGGDYEFNFLSLDNALLFSYNIKAKDEKLSLELHSKQKFAKILIFTQDTTKPFKLSNLKLLTRKYNGLFVSITDDGLGCRLINLIVTMYLAHISGLKFGFVWKSELNACGTDDLRANIKQYGFDILLPQIQSEEYIFDDDFIKKHSYTSVIQRQAKHLARGISLEKIQNELPFLGAFGWSYQDSGMHISGVDKAYLKELPKFYARIQFSKHINFIIKEAKNLALSLNGFIVLHLRIGDVVYDKHIKNQGLHHKKVTPIEIAFELLSMLSKDDKVVVFSDDIATLKSLIKTAKETLTHHKEIYSILDFLPSGLNEVDRVFFEVHFMSKAKEIFSSFSHFSTLASLISKGKNPQIFFQIFSEKEQEQIIKKHLEKIQVHKLLQAHSYMYLYFLARARLASVDELEKIVSRALELDDESLFYKIAFLDILLSKKRYSQAEMWLDKLFKDDEEVFFNYLFKGALYTRFKEVKHHILSLGAAQGIHEFKNLQKLIFKVKIKEGLNKNKIGAVKRVENMLSYRLGKTYLNTHLFSLFQALRKTNVEFKAYQQALKELETQKIIELNPLFEYADFLEANELKNGLEFQIGELIKKADKSPFKLGYIRLVFKISKLKKQYLILN